jgi:hypothetical protein
MPQVQSEVMVGERDAMSQTPGRWRPPLIVAPAAHALPLATESALPAQTSATVRASSLLAIGDGSVVEHEERWQAEGAGLKIGDADLVAAQL